MDFEPDTEWFPDAGGITEISPAAAGLISDVPPGQTLPSALKVHDTL